MTDQPLHERIAARALRHVSNPPAGDDCVVRLATPDQLAEAFSASVGLELSGEAHSDADVMAAVDCVIDYSVHTTHPRFMNQNYAGADPVAVVGDWLGAALNTTNATFEVAPVFTIIERAVLRRLAELIGYQAAGGSLAPGLFCAGGSLAGLMALQLARDRFDPQIGARGMSGQRFAIFVSTAGHYSAVKNAAVMGLGTDAVIEVAVDNTGAMIAGSLATAIGASRAAGATPLAVIATAGTTVTAAFDPIDAIADICDAEQLWLHVDGCYGGSALFSPRERHRLVGAERSDSMAWNFHKMMGMTQQCSALLVRDASQLETCFATGADYIFQADKEHGQLDPGDRTIMCGRRVDVLKLWLAWKSSGDEGFAARIDHAVEMANHARERIVASDGEFAMVTPGDFTNVCFVWVPPDLRPLDLERLAAPSHERLHTLAPAIKARMQREGTALVGYQPVRGINAFRIIVMNPAVSQADIDTVLGLIASYGHALGSAPN